MAKKKTPAKKRAPKNPLLAQFAKFFSVGLSNTLIDFTVYSLVNYAFGVPVAQASRTKYLSGTVAMINSFYWNRRWTFKSHANVGKSGLKFVVATLVSVYLITPTIVAFFTNNPTGLAVGNFWYSVATGLGLGHIFTQAFVVRTFAFGMSVIGAGIWDFTLYKLWAFRQD